MKIFEIEYIGRLGYDNKEYYTETVKAQTEKRALTKFAKARNLNADDIINGKTWWDNEWLMSFKCLNEIQEEVCQTCNGKGKITIIKCH